MSKIVLGTASWGQKDYGLKKDKVPLRMIRAILKRATDAGIKFVHWKPVYENVYGVTSAVLDLIKNSGLKTVTPPDFYDTPAIEQAVTEHKTISVMYNPIRQVAMDALHAYGGTVYARSIFLQGFLADARVGLPPKWKKSTKRRKWLAKMMENRDKIRSRCRELNLTLPQYCLAGALYHPYIDYVILGLNTLGELENALKMERVAKPLIYQAEYCMGEHDGTDPRNW